MTLDLRIFSPPDVTEIEIEPSFSPDWCREFIRCNNVAEEYASTAFAMLNNIVPATLVGSRKQDGQDVAYGYGVMEGEYVGLFDIVVDTHFRRSGHGNALICGLIQHSRERGVMTAYLQVVSSNAPAVSLYKSLGFQEAYRYFSRKKDFR